MVRCDAATGDCFLPFQPCSLASCPQHAYKYRIWSFRTLAPCYTAFMVSTTEHTQCSASLPCLVFGTEQA